MRLFSKLYTLIVKRENLRSMSLQHTFCHYWRASKIRINSLLHKDLNRTHSMTFGRWFGHKIHQLLWCFASAKRKIK